MNKIITPGQPGFHIHKRNYIEVNAPDIGFEVSGHFNLRRIKEDGRVVQELAFDNLLTNIMLDVMAGTSWDLRRCHVGTGTTTPAVTDTALQTFGVSLQNADGTAGGDGNSGSPDYYKYSRRSWTSSIGGATGNWTEIGISSTQTTGNLRSRALILDGGGNPTAFTVLSDEQLQADYELRVYPKLTDSLETVDISGVAYNTITRALEANAYINGNFVAAAMGTACPANVNITVHTGNLVGIAAGAVSGWLGGSGALSPQTYTPGSHYRDGRYTMGAGSFTATHRTYCINYSNAQRLQVQYDKVVGGGGIVKAAGQQLIINQRFSWARR